MVGCIGSSEHKNRIFIIGGPEVPDNIVTYKDSLMMIFESMGKEPKLVSAPGWLITAVIRITWIYRALLQKNRCFFRAPENKLLLSE